MVHFKRADFMNEEYLTEGSDVIVFNNYAKWFDTENPGKQIDLNQEFANKVCFKVPIAYIHSFQPI